MSDSLSLKQLVLGDLELELDLTRDMLERAPEEHFDWKPHEKSMSLGTLAAHLVNLLVWQKAILRGDKFDLGSTAEGSVPESREALLAAFDEKRSALERTFAATDDTALVRSWRLQRGDEVVFEQPRATVLRQMGASHMIHHRAQLGVYLRLLDVPVPPTYGPTADEGGS